MRIGLTGGMGSGKSTVARMLGAKGAHILSADDLARTLMQPGEPVFAAIVRRFGTEMLSPDGTLNRPALAKLAFTDDRIEELNAIVHPAAIELQNKLSAEILLRDPKAVVVTESALIFETEYGGDWRERFNALVLVCAPDKLKIARFCARTGGDPVMQAKEAKRRLARMIPDGDKVAMVQYVIRNDGTLEALQDQVDDLWEWIGMNADNSKYEHGLRG